MDIAMENSIGASDSLDHASSCPSSSASIVRNDEEKKEAIDDLLEECWFFENLFKTKSRMLRCNSDPSPSSTPFSSGDSSGKKDVTATPGGCSGHRSLVRTPSLPPCLGRSEERKGTRKLASQKSYNFVETPKPKPKPKPSMEKNEGGGSGSGSANRSKLMGRGHLASCRNLLRTPSLPLNIGTERERTGIMYEAEPEDDKESESRMSRLIQEAFANSNSSSEMQQLQPKHSSNSKVMTHYYAISRHRPPKTPEVVESSNSIYTKIKETNRRSINNQNKIKKSFSLLEFDEVRRFKEVELESDKQESSPKVVNTLSGLQEVKREGEKEEKSMNQRDNYKMKRPQFSKTWLGQKYEPSPIGNCIANDSSQDMKMQIKFWARAVASNVQQEC